MPKLRRRSTSTTAASDLPYCPMCGQTVRLDSSTGRCALGHRVVASPVAAATAVATPAPVAEAPAPADPPGTADPIGGYVDQRLAELPRDSYDPYEGFTTSGAGWETPASGTPAPLNSGLDEFLAWDEPTTGFSSLDVTPEELDELAEAVVTPADVPPAPVHNDVTADLLDELDDATHARRRAVGTIGATIGFTGLVLATVAVLPF